MASNPFGSGSYLTRFQLIVNSVLDHISDLNRQKKLKKSQILQILTKCKADYGVLDVSMVQVKVALKG